MKKSVEVVAIIGGCGRIGSALTDDLLKQGYKIEDDTIIKNGPGNFDQKIITLIKGKNYAF